HTRLTAPLYSIGSRVSPSANAGESTMPTCFTVTVASTSWSSMIVVPLAAKQMNGEAFTAAAVVTDGMAALVLSPETTAAITVPRPSQLASSSRWTEPTPSKAEKSAPEITSGAVATAG